ncbi:hypothetical protein AB1N83_006996 [Pleurotus pulmonarius]
MLARLRIAIVVSGSPCAIAEHHERSHMMLAWTPLYFLVVGAGPVSSDTLLSVVTSELYSPVDRHKANTEGIVLTQAVHHSSRIKPARDRRRRRNNSVSWHKIMIQLAQMCLTHPDLVEVGSAEEKCNLHPHDPTTPTKEIAL